MLRIGYVRRKDPASAASDGQALKQSGCHVVRAEEPALPANDEASVLESILDFIADGDQLVVPQLDQLSHSGRRLLEILGRLEQRGASLRVLEPAVDTRTDGARPLRAALQAVAALEPIPLSRRRRQAAAGEILELQKAGVGPVEIARRLGVSRMTVWRKLKAVGA